MQKHSYFAYKKKIVVGEIGLLFLNFFKKFDFEC